MPTDIQKENEWNLPRPGRSLICIDPFTAVIAISAVVVIANSSGCGKSDELAYTVEYDQKSKTEIVSQDTIDLTSVCTGTATYVREVKVNRQITLQQISNGTSVASLVPDGIMNGVKEKLAENARKQYAVSFSGENASKVQYPLTCGMVYKCWTEETSRNGIVKFTRGGSLHSSAAFRIPFDNQWKCAPMDKTS